MKWKLISDLQLKGARFIFIVLRRVLNNKQSRSGVLPEARMDLNSKWYLNEE